MIENIVILDTETTGLIPKNGAKIIEVATILFNLKHRETIQYFSTLLPCEENPVESINHISAELTKIPYTLIYLDQILMGMVDNAQAIVAHNAKFDKQFVSLLGCGRYLLHQNWICTKENFTWPVKLLRLRLEDICKAMGVEYANPHRALQDCILLARCFEKIEDLETRFNSISCPPKYSS